MNTELATDFYLAHLLPKNCNDGALIEVGLGCGNWSFVWGASRGLKCVAVEPAPVDKLRRSCLNHNVILIEAAVGRELGRAKLYSGQVGGHLVSDTNSLKSSWWAAGSDHRMVDVLDLPSVLRTAGVSRLHCLKIDVEGAEADVISGLTELPGELLPDLVAFEYGGGGTVDHETGGWTSEGMASTTECLNTLYELGYKWGLLCERVLDRPLPFDMEHAVSSVAELFPPSAEVGNIIAARVPRTHELKDWEHEYLRIERKDRWNKRMRQMCGSLAFYYERYRQALRTRVKF